MLWNFVAEKSSSPVKLITEWSYPESCTPFLSFKAPSVRDGPQQPAGSELHSFSTWLQQFGGCNCPGSLCLHPTTLYLHLWCLWPSALGRAATQNSAPQYRLLHGMKILYNTLCIFALCHIYVAFSHIANYSVVSLQCHIACLSIWVYIVTVRLKSSVISYDHIGAGIWGAWEKQWQAAIKW